MQLSDIRDAVRLHYGMADNDPMSTDVVLTALVNSSLRRIATLHDWPWLEATHTQTITPLAHALTGFTYRRVLQVDSEFQNLEYLPSRGVVKAGLHTGSPQAFIEYGGVFTVYPKPDKDYDITAAYIIDTEPELSGDTDEPLLPNRAIELLISDVCLLVSRRTREERSEARFYSERERYLKVLEGDMVRSHDGITPYHV